MTLPVLKSNLTIKPSEWFTIIVASDVSNHYFFPGTKLETDDKTMESMAQQSAEETPM